MLEEKYQILAGNIDYFDTAEPVIFLIVASRLIIKMTVLFLSLFVIIFIIIYHEDIKFSTFDQRNC